MKEKIRIVMPWVVSVAVLIATVAVQCVVLSAKLDVLGSEFWTNLAVNVSIIGIVAVVWLYAGRDKASQTSEEGAPTPYQSALEEYGEYVARVQDKGLITEFETFCMLKTEEFRHRREICLLRSVCIEWEKYEELKDRSRRELKALGFKRKQISAILRISKGKVKARPIHALEILTDSRVKERDGYDVNYDEGIEVATKMAIKIAQAMVTSIALAVLVVQVTDNIRSPDLWVMFAMKVALVVWNAWSGYMTGYRLISERKKKVLRKRADFIRMFFEQKAGE